MSAVGRPATFCSKSEPTVVAAKCPQGFGKGKEQVGRVRAASKDVQEVGGGLLPIPCQ